MYTIEIPSTRRTQNTKCLILGFAPSVKEAPVEDPSWDVWGLNELYAQLPMQKIAHDRLTWFDIHTLEVMKGSSRDGKRVENLAALQCPLYTQRLWAALPNSIPYPLAEMTYKYFQGDGDTALTRAFEFYLAARPDADPLVVARHGYWTNTVTMMILLAVEFGYETIGIYGVDMASDSEYGHQRPSCEYALGYARGRGVRVEIPPSSDLVKAHFIYGWEEKAHDWFREKLDEKLKGWKKNQEAAEAKVGEQQAVANQFSGAWQAGQDILKIFGQ